MCDCLVEGWWRWDDVFALLSLSLKCALSMPEEFNFFPVSLLNPFDFTLKVLSVLSARSELRVHRAPGEIHLSAVTNEREKSRRRIITFGRRPQGEDKIEKQEKFCWIIFYDYWCLSATVTKKRPRHRRKFQTNERRNQWRTKRKDVRDHHSNSHYSSEP